MTLKEQLNSYKIKLEELENKCSIAEKEAIVAETNYKNYQKTREDLIKECEEFTGVPYNDTWKVYQEAKDKLDKIMSLIPNIDDKMEISSEMLEELKNIVEKINENN